ncbi:MAG: metalloregulator ArsR/SmtB family transcription factor [Thermoplasmata archaeon]|nr:metalloregulator ArsR/SmtB family transcription factor [Thermoplasmata archaeon]
MKIPEEIECRLKKRGGIKALVKGLPDQEILRNVAEVFNAIGEPLRLKILLLLCEQDLCVCVIKEICGTPDSKLSYHLAVMKGAGLIDCREEGNWLIYFPTKQGRKVARFARTLEGMMEDQDGHIKNGYIPH